MTSSQHNKQQSLKTEQRQLNQKTGGVRRLYKGI